MGFSPCSAWNYSFFNALYFAINGSHFKEDCIIWAINKAWLQKQARRLEATIFRKIRTEEHLGRGKARRLRRY
jgi:hypothetical protein